MSRAFSPDSRVWVYTADRTLQQDELQTASAALSQFCKEWTAHNQALKADFMIPYGRFIVLMVDQSNTEASGCSIDKSVRFLKDLSAKLDIDFFKRLEMPYLEGENIRTVAYGAIPDQVSVGLIHPETLFFNPRVSTLSEFDSEFLLPLNKHWLGKSL